MRKRGEPEGGPEQRKHQFEDSRGLSDSPELPLDPDAEPHKAEKTKSEAAAEEEEDEKEEDDTEGGFE